MEDEETVLQENQTEPKKETVKQTPQEFSAKIKEKYPQYKDIDDIELAQKIIAKYPVYKNQVDFTVKKKEDSNSTEPNQKLDSEAKAEVGSLASQENEDGRGQLVKDIDAETQTENDAKEQAETSEINDLLTSYETQTGITQEDINAIDSQLKNEQSGNFGWFSKVKDIATQAWTGLKPANDRQVGIYNTKKELAKTQGVSIDEVNQAEAEKVYTENRKAELINSKRQEKTEEFIEQLGEEGQMKLNRHFNVQADKLTKKSQSLLLDIEASKKELDVIGPEYEAITNELEQINANHDETKQYDPEYYEKHQALREKALKLEEQIKQLGHSLKSNTNDFSNTREDLLSTAEEIDLFKRNYKTLDNFTGKFNAATGDLLLGIGYVMNKGVGLNPLYKASSLALEKKINEGKESLEEKREYLRKAKTVDDINSWEDASEWALDLVANQAPNTILMATTGGASLGVMGVSTAGSKLYELEKQEREGTADYSELEKYASAFITGTAEALSEKVSLGQIGAAKRVFSTVAKDRLKENTIDYVKRVLPKYLQDTIEEGGTEVLSQLAENITDKYLLGNDDVNLTDGLKESFVSGAFMSGVVYKAPGIARGLSKPFIPKDVNQRIGENFERIAAINTQLNNDINDTTRKKLTAKKETLLEQNKAILDKSLSNIDNLSTKQKGQLLAIEKEKHKLRKEADDVLNETEIDNQTKESLLEDVKTNVERLEAKKNEILNPTPKKEAANGNETATTPSETKNNETPEAETPSPEVEQTQDDPTEVISEGSQLTFKEAIEQEGVYEYEGQKGNIVVEGQQVEFHSGNNIYELGNIDEVSESTLEEYGIEREAEIDITVNEDNSITVAGERYINNYSNPEAAITQDKEGNYSVSLETENGEKRTFRGQRAEQIVYQTKLKSYQENATEPEIDRAIELADEALNIEEQVGETSIERENKRVRKGKKRGSKRGKQRALKQPKLPPKVNPEVDNTNENVNVKADLSKYEIVEDAKGKKFYKTDQKGKEGVSKYIPVGQDVYIDNNGIERPSETERNAMVGTYMNDSEFKPVTPKTQKEIVEDVLKEGEPKSIKEIAEETKIKEPNIRRILGVGAKEGTFERVDKGVYVLNKDGEDLAYVEAGNSVEVLPRLAEEGFKADMVFLDIPYDTPAVKGGNRGVKYNLISVEEFKTIVDAIKKIAKEKSTPIIHMYSNAKSGWDKMKQYNEVLEEAGFQVVGKGFYKKYFKNGKPVSNVQGKEAAPEGILVYNQTGKTDLELNNFEFHLERPRGYSTEKNPELLKTLIESTTIEGDMVLDPFAGSGVTGEQAVKSGRKAYLVEKNKDAIEGHIKPKLKKAADEKAPKQSTPANGDVQSGTKTDTKQGESNNVQSTANTKPSEGKTEIDEAERQKLLGAIQEGELLLKSGKKVSGAKYSPEELKVIQKSVDNAKAKLGINTKDNGKTVKKETDKVRSKTRRSKSGTKTKGVSQDSESDRKPERTDRRGRVPLDKRKLSKERTQALDIEVNDARGLVMQAFISGTTMTSEGLKEVFSFTKNGNKRVPIEEIRGRSQYLRRPEKGGKTFKEIVHSIYQSKLAQNLGLSDSDIRDAAIDVLTEYYNPQQMALALINNYSEGTTQENTESGEEVFDTPYGPMTQSQINDFILAEEAAKQSEYALETHMDALVTLDLMTDEELTELAKERELVQRLDIADFDAKLGKDKPKPIKPEPSNKSTEKIEDYGEKIGGARKDLYNSFDGLTKESIESQPLSKSFPEPDYKKLVEEGVLSETAAKIIKFVYKSIPNKPRSKYRLTGWSRTVQNAIDMYKDLLSDNDNAESNAQKLDESISASMPKYVVYKEMLDAIGFPTNDIKLGAYDIVKFTSNDGSEYAITKGSRISGRFKTMQEAVINLKLMLEKNKNNKKSVKLSVFEDRITKALFIGWRGSGKSVRLMEGFNSVSEAHKFLKENYDTLEKQFLDMKVNPEERRDSNRKRVGNDWRKGKDVKVEEFGKIFGFRGVEFGNWVNNAERQEAINEAYDAFMDLANVLGITPNSLSLNGTLAMAFGARGRSKAMAHYESHKVVINLTKKKGAGSLAHEWFHALDNHLERHRTNKVDDFLTEYPRRKMLRDGTMDKRVNPKTIEAFNELMKAIANSNLKTRSLKLDQFKSKAYWSTAIEMSARAFENYIIESLAAQNEQNDFLANFKESGEWLAQSGLDLDNYPYPLKEESPAINEAFQNLFETLQVGTKDGKDYFVQEEDTTGIDLANKLGIDKMANLLDELQKKLDKGTEGTLGIHIPAAIAQVAISAMKVAVKTAKTTADVISAGIDAIKKTEWYNKLTDKRKADINEYNLQSVIKTATKTVNELDDKIENLRERLREGKVQKREAFNEIKSFLKSNKIKGKVTPTEINRLINRASRLLVARDSNKAMDDFVEEYRKVSIKAKKRAISKRDKNKDIDSKFVADMTTRLINEGKTLDEIKDYFDLPREKKAAEAVWHRLKNNKFTPEQALADAENTYKEAQAIINKKKTTKELINSTRRSLIQLFSDRQYLPKKLVKASGMKGTFNLFVNSKGSSGRANRIYEEAYNAIYKNLSKEDRNLLDLIIQSRRVIAIDKNREDRGLGPVNHPNNTFGEKEQAALDALKDKLGDDKFNDLNDRATAYFDVFKQILADAEKSGLVSPLVKDMFENVDYQPRLFLQHITNFNEEVSTNNEAIAKNNNGGLSRDQIASMKEGDAGLLMTDSAWLLSTVLNTRYKSIAINNINRKFMTEEFPKAKERYENLLEDQKNGKEISLEDKRFMKYFKELDSKIIDNPQIGVTESGNPKYKYDSTPPHFAKAYYYVNGTQHQFFIEKELHQAWFDNLNGFLGANAKEFISYASGAALVKGIATGNNPAFAIVNTPRDFMFTAVFSNEYSGILPKAMFQVAKDSIKAIGEIRNFNKKNKKFTFWDSVKEDFGVKLKPYREDNLFNKYIEYGGDMSFLSTQGRLSKNTHLGRAIEGMTNPKLKDKGKSFFDAVTFKKFSTYSEIMFRMALFQRSIKNQLKTLGLESMNDVKDQEKIDEIYNEAVANARGLLDFNQGGTITKDMESFIPYINTGVQGTRVAFDALKSDPKTVTSKILQAAALGTVAPIGISLALISMMKGEEDEEKSNYEIYIDAINGVSKYQKAQYFNIVTGRKEDGEYEVVKIAKNQQLIPVLSLTDNIVQNRIRKMIGQKKRATEDIYSDAWFAFNTNIMPLDITSGAGMITRTPAIKATLTYATGHDFFRDQPLTNDINKVPREVEGFKSKSVEDFYKVFGEETGLSPARTKGAVESMITSPSTNPFIGMMYGGAEAIVSDEGFKKASKDFGMSVLKSVNKRIFSKTSDFNRTVEANERVKEYIDKIKADKLRHDFYGNKTAKAFANGEISANEFAKELGDKYPEDVKRLLNKAKEFKMSKGVDRNVINIKYEQNTKAKAYLIAYHYGDIFDGSPESQEVLTQMKKAGGIITESVLKEFVKLREELGLNK